MPQDIVAIPTFDHVDAFSGARDFAMLGWVVSAIADMAEAKARDDRREAHVAADIIATRARRRRQARAVRAMIRKAVAA